MERNVAFVGIISCFFFGLVLCQDEPVKLTITKDISVLPTPDNPASDAEKVSVTINCIGSRSDVSFYIKNRVNITFVDNKGNYHPITSAFYEAKNDHATSRFANGHYTFTTGPEAGAGYVFKLKIDGVTHEDDGVYVCVLLNRDEQIEDQVETRLTVLNPVESLKLEIHHMNHSVIASSTFPLYNDQTPIKLTPGQYMVTCNASGSNPEPIMSLHYNEMNPYVSVQTDKRTDTDRIQYSGQFHVMSMDIKAMEGEQTLVCTANIAGNYFPTKEAGLKMMVHADKPDIVCENVTARIGMRYRKVNCNVTTPDGGAGLTCNKIAWIIGDNNKHMAPGEKYRDDKFDIIEAGCMPATDGLTTMVNMYLLKDDHFKTIFYVQYGSGEQAHRVPVQLNLDTTAGSSVVAPISLLALIVMTTVSRLLL